ncbi:hypothetical protein MRX96_002729 [Rhipicephalus microplus]
MQLVRQRGGGATAGGWFSVRDRPIAPPPGKAAAPRDFKVRPAKQPTGSSHTTTWAEAVVLTAASLHRPCGFVSLVRARLKCPSAFRSRVTVSSWHGRACGSVVLTLHSLPNKRSGAFTLAAPHGGHKLTSS